MSSVLSSSPSLSLLLLSSWSSVIFTHQNTHTTQHSTVSPAQPACGLCTAASCVSVAVHSAHRHLAGQVPIILSTSLWKSFGLVMCTLILPPGQQPFVLLCQLFFVSICLKPRTLWTLLVSSGFFKRITCHTEFSVGYLRWEWINNSVANISRNISVTAQINI